MVSLETTLVFLKVVPSKVCNRRLLYVRPTPATAGALTFHSVQAMVKTAGSSTSTTVHPIAKRKRELEEESESAQSKKTRSRVRYVRFSSILSDITMTSSTVFHAVNVTEESKRRAHTCQRVTPH